MKKLNLKLEIPLIIFLFFSGLGLSQAAIEETSQGNSWHEITQDKKGAITVWFFNSQSAIYINKKGEIEGIEYDLFNEFVKYLKKEYNYEVTIKWNEATHFSDVYNHIRDNSPKGTFGASLLSITEERKKEVVFSPPYLPDYSVLVTSNNVPMATTSEEFKTYFKNLTAVLLPNSTHEENIKWLESNELGALKYNYIMDRYKNLEQIIAGGDDMFGYMDLPAYIISLKYGNAVKRQLMYPIKRTGYAFIYGKESDWNEPIEKFFNDPGFKAILTSILKKHMGNEFFDLFWAIVDPGSVDQSKEVSLLVKEKEIQTKKLLNAAIEIEQQKNVRNLLLFNFSFLIIVSLIIYNRYKLKKRSHLLLEQKNQKIQGQQEEINQQNKSLENKNRELTEANIEKNNLLGIVAHDLKSPLNQIKGLMTIINFESETLSKGQKEACEMINQSIDRLNQMITKILSIDALNNQQLDVEFVSVDIGEILTKIAKEHTVTAAHKNITIEFKNGHGPCHALADAKLIIQVFENLISNAIKFSPFHKKIYLGIEIRNADVVTWIKDEGPGLSEKDMRLLYTKYAQLSAKPTNNESSSGLGLSIVKKYTDLMNGHVWCESKPNEGATFYVSFGIVTTQQGSKFHK